MLRSSFAAVSLLFLSQPTFANTLFDEPNQATPLNTMQSMIDLGKECSLGSSSSCRHLTKFCHENGDEDVWTICLIGGADEKS